MKSYFKYFFIFSVLTAIVLFKSPDVLAECGYGVTTATGDACDLQNGQTKSSGYFYCDADMTLCCTKASECPAGSDPMPVSLSPYQGPTTEFFNALNPLYTHGNQESATLTTPGAVVSRVLRYALPIAGMILFVMLLWGGFEILVGSAGKKSLDAGKQRITAAFVGFILLFVSYWIMQILEIIFGISIV